MNDMFLNVSTFNDLLEILKNKNSYLDNTDSRLEIIQKKEQQIKTYLEQLTSSNLTSKDTLMNTTEILNIIKSIIDNLLTLKESLDVIEKNILQLIIKKEDSSYTSSVLNEDIIKVKKQIDEFDDFSKKLDKDIAEKYSIIKVFFDSDASLAIFSSGNDDNAFELSKSTPLNIIDISAQTMVAPEIDDNFTLRISEKDNKVYLPYSKAEIIKYLETYPDVFKDASNVINREFIVDLTFYTRYSFLARFREVYSLIRNREMKSFADALKRAFDLMFRYDLNPAIVAGLKSEAQLDLLLECIEKNTLEDFTPFKIIFEITPVKKHKFNV